MHEGECRKMLHRSSRPWDRAAFHKGVSSAKNVNSRSLGATLPHLHYNDGEVIPLTKWNTHLGWCSRI